MKDSYFYKFRHYQCSITLQYGNLRLLCSESLKIKGRNSELGFGYI